MMKNYILSIVIAAIFCAVSATLLPPKTAGGRISNLLCGILLIITVLSPLTNISFRHITDYLKDFSYNSDYYVNDGLSAAQDEIDKIIKSESEAYILDKANQMDLQIAVEVALDENNHSIPCSIVIAGAVSPYSKEILSEYITDSLGVAKENQIWISKD